MPALSDRSTLARSRPVPAKPKFDRSFNTLEHHARTYGSSYDSYIATDTDGKEYFWADDCSGVLCTIPVGRYVFIYGGILAPEQGRRRLMERFLAQCAERRVTPSFFNAGIEDVELLREFGFQATKFGEEPIVELNQCTWKGKNYEWVRRQTNFCKRNHIQFEEVRREELSTEQWSSLMDEMDLISNHFLEEKPHAGRMRNVVSRFCRKLIFGQRIFIARNTLVNQVEAFVICSPCLDGRMWAIESYRKRRDAVRGVIPFLMHQCMTVFQQEEVPSVTLSMLPLIRCEEARPGDSWVLRKIVGLAQKRGGALYDSAGLYHFKTRFRPHRFEDRYICAKPRVGPGMLIAGMKSWGFLEVSPATTAKKMFRQLLVRKSRKQLATPGRKS